MVSFAAAAVLALLVTTTSPLPPALRHPAPDPIDVAALRHDALQRYAPQVRSALAEVPVVLALRPLPRTAPGAAACFDPRTGVVTLGEDIERAYGHAFALSALMHEYGHALAWRYFGWDLRVFRTRFLTSAFLADSDRAYPAFTAFVRRHHGELLERTDYSEVFPSVLLELRSAAVLPPPLRAYVAAVMWP